MEQPRQVVTRNSEGGIGAVPKMWAQADNLFDQYRSLTPGSIEQEAIKNQLTGMTVVMYLVMRPYYADRDEIVREIMARAEARSRGEEPRTKGMGWVSVAPEDGGTPFETAFSGRGYTSDPAYMTDPPWGYPQERINAVRIKHEERKVAEQVVASTPRAKPGYVAPAGLLEKVEEIKQRSVAGFDNKLLAQAYGVTLSDIAWALKQ